MRSTSIQQDNQDRWSDVFTIGLVFSGAGSAAVAAGDSFDLKYLIDPRDWVRTGTWETNFPGVPYSTTDITAFRNIPVDLIVGSPPCSSYSLLNRTKTRLDLYATDPEEVEYVAFIDEIIARQPKSFILENLPRIRDFLYFPYNPTDPRLHIHYYDTERERFETKPIRTLHGYQIYQYVINTVDLGLAQRRERLFIIGVKEDYSWTYQVPRLSEPTRLNQALKSIPPNATCHQKDFLKKKDAAMWRALPYNKKTEKKSMKLQPKKPAPTVVSGSLRHFHWLEPRYLTPRECAVLQGFPLDFHFDGSTLQQLNQIGRAIAVPIVKSLSDQIAISLQSKEEQSFLDRLIADE